MKLVFNESLTAALKDQTEGKVDLVIGKCSVVEFDAKKLHLTATQVAMLTGKDGTTTQNGLIVVPKDDPAQSAADLKGYRIIFGPKECDEKHDAVLALLKKSGVDAPCRVGNLASLQRRRLPDPGSRPRQARGRGHLQLRPAALGRLRHREEGGPAGGRRDRAGSVRRRLCRGGNAAEQKQITEALLKVTEDPLLRIALETRDGFVAPDASPPLAAKKSK